MMAKIVAITVIMHIFWGICIDIKDGLWDNKIEFECNLGECLFNQGGTDTFPACLNTC